MLTCTNYTVNVAPCAVLSQLVPSTTSTRSLLISGQSNRVMFQQATDVDKKKDALDAYLSVWRAVYKAGQCTLPSSKAPVVFTWNDQVGIGGRFDAYSFPSMQFEHCMLCVCKCILNTSCARDIMIHTPKDSLTLLQEAHQHICEADVVMQSWNVSPMLKAFLPAVLHPESLGAIKQNVCGWQAVAFAQAASLKQLYQAESESWARARACFDKCTLHNVPAELWNSNMVSLTNQCAVKAALALSQQASISHAPPGTNPPIGRALAALQHVRGLDIEIDAVEAAIERLSKDNNSVYFQSIVSLPIEPIELPKLPEFSRETAYATVPTVALL